MGSPGAALLSPWPEVHPGHRPRAPPVDGPRQRHQCQGDSLVPRAPGLPLRCASPRRGRARQRRRSLSRIWAAFAGLSGVTPHPPPINPLLSHVSNRTRTTLRGGECDERPGISSASPWKRRQNTCTSSLPADRPQLQLISRQPYKSCRSRHC